jgi:hypothetical protein
MRTYDERGQSDHWMAWLTSYRIHRLAALIRERVSSKKSKIVLTNTSHRILDGILEHEEASDLRKAEDKYLLLDHVFKTLCQKGQVDVL